MSDRLRLLYVDDDDDIRAIAMMALQLDPGMDVRGVASGKAALAMLDGDSWRPQLFLLDVMMPEMDGLALAGEIKRRPDTAGTPFLFMTARAREMDVQSYLDLGAIGVIAKPFDPLGLPGRIRALAAEHVE